MKTKIIATVGPSCSTKEKLDLLIESGVTCFRVNLSHGTKNEKAKYFELIKSCRLESGIRPTVLADLAGPKIRVSKVKDSIKIQKVEKLYIIIAITTCKVKKGKVGGDIFQCIQRCPSPFH